VKTTKNRLGDGNSSPSLASKTVADSTNTMLQELQPSLRIGANFSLQPGLL
jgi:hypothetical protein